MECNKGNKKLRLQQVNEPVEACGSLGTRKGNQSLAWASGTQTEGGGF